MKDALKFWIKERFNPQLGTYFVGCGQLTKGTAKKMERPIYGSSIMHPFDTFEEYVEALARFQKKSI